jgi:hypothetical protein
VDEFSALVSVDTITFKAIAPLVNLRLEESVDEIALPNGLAIVRLSEEEVNLLYGGAYPFLRRWGSPLIEFAIRGELKEAKILGGDDISETAALNELQGRMDRLVMALRTFRHGPVGYQDIHLSPTSYAPLGHVTRTFGHEYIPFGSYYLSSAEVPAFRDHAQRLMGEVHQTLEIACSRLADAMIRLKDRDKLIDAVIGLEAILLKNKEDLKYRGEVRYRFGMHYASLFDTPAKKREQFLVARDMYDLRSSIAHGGGSEGDRHKIGNEKLTLPAAAKKACDMLHGLVVRFSSSAASPEYWQDNYWQERLFGVREKEE